MTSTMLLAFTMSVNAQGNQNVQGDKDDLSALNELLAGENTPVVSDTSAQPEAADETKSQVPEAEAAQPAAVTATAQPDLPMIPVPAKKVTMGEPPQPERTRPKQIEEVVVTATKTEASARDIPVTIQAMRGDDLVQQGATTLEDILKNSPSVNITQEQVSIRGMGLSSFVSANTGEETGFFLGEATMAPPSSGGATIDFDPYDLSTVEILEGPQSTLFGGTALAGAVRYIPNRPQMDAFHGSLRAGYGTLSHADDHLKDISAMLNAPIGETFALRAVGTIRQKPNVGRDTSGDNRDLNKSEVRQGRVMARWAITDKLSADLLYSRLAREGNLNLLDRPDSYDTAINRTDQPDRSRVDIGSLNVSYAFDAFSLVGVINTLKNHRFSILDGGPVLGVPGIIISLPATSNANADVPSYELRVASSQPSESSWWMFNNWDYIAGLYYMKADQDSKGLISLSSAGLDGLLGPLLPGGLGLDATGTRSLVNVSERAFFFNLNRSVLDDQLEVNFGARFAKTELSSVLTQSAAGIDTGSSQSSGNGHRINPKFALTWHFTDDVNIRATMSEGFRFGGGNSAPTMAAENIPPTFHSDSVRNYEVGLRSDWFDHTLRFDLTGYRMDWADMQVTQLSPLASSYTDNVGAAKINGLEAQFTWRLPYDLPFIPEGLTLTSGVSLLNARTSEPFTSANGTVASGTRLPLSPRTAATLGLAWAGEWRDWTVNTTALASYAGSRTNQLQETYRFDPYTVYNASVRIANSAWPGSPAISLSGVNLTNEMILGFANAKTLNPQEFVFTAQGPRAVKLSLELSF